MHTLEEEHSMHCGSAQENTLTETDTLPTVPNTEVPMSENVCEPSAKFYGTVPENRSVTGSKVAHATVAAFRWTS